MDIRQIVADNVRCIRQARGMTQEELAWKTGISIAYIGNIERAENAASIVKIAQLAEVLGIAPELLLREGAHREV